MADGGRNMRFSIRYLITFVLVIFGSGGLFGQEESKARAFQFTTRAFGNDYFEGIYFRDVEGELALLEFSPFERTGIYDLPENATEVVFFRLVTDGRGLESEETIAVANLEGIESRAFVVFVAKQDPMRNLPYSIYVADESPGKFEAGKLRFLNLAGPPILARVGDETYSLEYGFGGEIQFDPNSIDEVRFQFAVRVSDSWKIVYSSGFRAHPLVGTLAILKPPSQIDSLQIQVEQTQRRYYFDPIEKLAESVDK